MDTFRIYREASPAAGDWRWSLKASNGRIIAEGGEGYERAIDLVRVVRRHIVRDSVLLEEALCRALNRARLDYKGRSK